MKLNSFAYSMLQSVSRVHLDSPPIPLYVGYDTFRWTFIRFWIYLMLQKIEVCHFSIV